MKLKTVWKIIYTTLLVIVIIFALLIIISAIPFPKGLRIYIVKSGSMAPTIKAGNLIFSKKQDTYSVGDIVTYLPIGGESKTVETITHRIVAVKDGNFITKGDANPSEDSESVTPKQVKGRYVFRMPYFGYVVSFAKTTPGIIFLIVIPGTIIIYGEVQNIISEIKKRKKQSKKKETK